MEMEDVMLHMLVNVHSPDHCGFRDSAEGTAFKEGFERIGTVAEGLNATVKDVWVNTGSHTVFALIDAPDAHVVERIVRETGLIVRSESRVYTIEDMQSVLKET
jgi:hypothetical protein